MVVGLWWIWMWVRLFMRQGRAPAPALHRGRVEPAAVRSRCAKKPEWAARQMVLLKAHLPETGCRVLADTFNRVFAHRNVSVSKSWVHRVLRERALEVWNARKAIRNAKPKAVAINHCWGMDLTGRVDSLGQAHTVLGILDHGSRRVLALRRVARKSSWHLLGYLCIAIGEFGKPRFLRTDNERCFAGRVFSTGLRWLGIRHQRIDLHCPWQNGRVERFFGTLKKYLKQWQFEGQQALAVSLAEFAHWYNEVRPHQNLGGLTPLEAWDGVDPFHAPQPPKDVSFFQAWDGLLCGFHIRR